MEFSPERQCHGKHTYWSKAEAKRAARTLQTALGREALGPDPLKAYRCPHGDHFHFGHVNAALRERLREAPEP